MPRRRLSVTGQVPARPPQKLRLGNRQKIPGPPSAATIVHRRWAHARSRLRFAPPRGTTFVASDIPVPDRSTTSRPIHADRRRPVVSASFDMPSLRAAAPIKCRLVAMVHSNLAVDAKTALLTLPPFVRLPSKTAPQASPNIAQPNEWDGSQETTTPSKSLQRRDTTYYFMHFDEPPHTSINYRAEHDRQSLASLTRSRTILRAGYPLIGTSVTPETAPLLGRANISNDV